MSLVAQGLAVLLGELHHRLLGRHEGLEAALVRLAPLRLLRRQVAVLMDGSIFVLRTFVCLFVCVKDVVSCFPRDGCES